MKSDKICFYCGGKANSKQHIIPRSFYPDGSKSNLITVYSCHKHNHEKRLLEERILLYFLGSSNTKLATSFAINKILPSLSHPNSKGLFKKILLTTSNDNKEILVEMADISNFIILLISALYYWHYQIILDRRILFITNKIRGKRLRYLKARFTLFRKTIFKKFNFNYIGDPKVFRYKFYTDDNYSYWLLSFYESVKIIIVINLNVQSKKDL